MFNMKVWELRFCLVDILAGLVVIMSRKIQCRRRLGDRSLPGRSAASACVLLMFHTSYRGQTMTAQANPPKTVVDQFVVSKVADSIAGIDAITRVCIVVHLSNLWRSL